MVAPAPTVQGQTHATNYGDRKHERERRECHRPFEDGLTRGRDPAEPGAGSSFHGRRIRRLKRRRATSPTRISVTPTTTSGMGFEPVNANPDDDDDPPPPVEPDDELPLDELAAGRTEVVVVVEVPDPATTGVVVVVVVVVPVVAAVDDADSASTS